MTLTWFPYLSAYLFVFLHLLPSSYSLNTLVCHLQTERDSYLKLSLTEPHLDTAYSPVISPFTSSAVWSSINYQTLLLTCIVFFRVVTNTAFLVIFDFKKKTFTDKQTKQNIFGSLDFLLTTWWLLTSYLSFSNFWQSLCCLVTSVYPLVILTRTLLDFGLCRSYFTR